VFVSSRVCIVLARCPHLYSNLFEQQIDTLYVTTPEHVAWLHGFFASWYRANGPMRYPQLYGTAVRADRDELIHFNNPSELPVLTRYSVGAEYRFLPSRDAAPSLGFIVQELKAKGWLKGTVAMENWSYLPNPAINAMFQGAFLAEGARVVDGSTVLRHARLVKSPAEIACIERAVEYADIGHRTILKLLKPGITELELFGEVTRDMMAAGSEFPALIPIFNALPLYQGQSGTSGHVMAGRRKIQSGEMLKADLSGVHNRYHGNIMRGYFLGDPSKVMIERHQKAAGAFPVFAREVKAGMTVGQVNAIMRRYYEEVGLWQVAGWGLGYEIGLSLPPDWVGEFFFNVRDDKWLERVFEDNMVTNYESLFNTWFVDTCVYGRSGTRFMSKIPLELFAV
jgi:Xaa-Pro aminopeptidase